LDRVVEQRRAQGLGVEPHPGADLRDPYGGGDEFVARVPLLVGVARTGEVEGALDLGAVDGRRHRHRGATEARNLLIRRRVELLDDREQVAEQLAVLYGNLGLWRNFCASECSSL